MSDNTIETTQLQQEIKERVTAYYTDYYRDQLGLPDWEERIQHRLVESGLYAKPKIERFGRWTNTPIDSNLRVLVVGGGTGAEFLTFAAVGCDVQTIEPNEEACEIIKLKARQAGVDPDRIQVAVAEDLPFEDDEFDLVWCHTVIEHVQDVEKSTKEIIRVMKPGGSGYIHTPDYRSWWEPHYKLVVPMFLPKFIIKLYLIMIGRPPQFLDTLQFVNARQMINIFQFEPVEAFLVFRPWHKTWRNSKAWRFRSVMLITRLFGIQRDQDWIIHKLVDHV